MVDVAQLVESRIVIPVVVGSRPIVHPIQKCESKSFHGFLFKMVAQEENPLHQVEIDNLRPILHHMFEAKSLIKLIISGKTGDNLLISAILLREWRNW